MSMWEILEIEATDDQKTIKRAYAKKLKAIRPEEDAEGFMALRMAYDDAIRWSQYSAYYDDEDYEDCEDCEDNAQQGNNVHPDDNGQPEEREAITLLVETEERDKQEVETHRAVEVTTTFELPASEECQAIMPSETEENEPSMAEENDSVYIESQTNLWEDYTNRLNGLLTDPCARLSILAWQSLLDHEIFWNLNTKAEAFEWLLDRLTNPHHLPRRVLWLLRDPVYAIVSDCNYYYHQNAIERMDFIHHWLVAMDHRLMPDVDGLRDKIASEKLEAYIHQWTLFQQTLQEGSLVEAQEWFEKAKAICETDPLLWVLGSELGLKNFDKVEATQCLNQVVALAKGDSELHYVLYNLGIQYKKPGLRRPIAQWMGQSSDGEKINSVIMVREAISEFRFEKLTALTQTLSFEPESLWHELHLRRLYDECREAVQKYPKSRALRALADKLKSHQSIFVGLAAIPDFAEIIKEKRLTGIIMLGILMVIVVAAIIVGKFFGGLGIFVGIGVLIYAFSKYEPSSNSNGNT